ncbi:hypothetical protein AT246_05730 [Bartonella henselae]|uniref:Uncharacterized protein n=1 Tax=Bartonella henselae TaxID=38323 RepID=X5LVR6_BARHN|nr:hypothetical protein [Bartonella henselae]ETS07327.1 hypothetical protein Q653_01393 [Bartonella henselae JK 42]ETS08490.1 hypothetical protein Q655_00756 [Bartonella henselae JK 51]ETS09037.1 hypothetical protein Q654_00803 [Bartonella henselae JK 50]ETS12028.1 hypothetical protein Q652_01368 [Bartonella henselae JK 41]KEC56327.1 hypothetical protein O97_01294 [Bartonella henselae str. Zeus]KEC59029.1 hypothetical protein O95_01272 [Bartonella henselae JK 53]
MIYKLKKQAIAVKKLVSRYPCLADSTSPNKHIDLLEKNKSRISRKKFLLLRLRFSCCKLDSTTVSKNASEEKKRKNQNPLLFECHGIIKVLNSFFCILVKLKIRTSYGKSADPLCNHSLLLEIKNKYYQAQMLPQK